MPTPDWPDTLARRVEEASLNAWPALQQLLYDGWWLRLSRGFTKRANSVVPLRRGSVPVDRKLAFCEAVYRRAGLTPVVRLATVHPLDDLDTRLEAAAWTTLDQTLVLACALPVQQPAGEGFVELDVDRWLDVYARFSAVPATARPLHRALLNGIALPCVFGAIERDGAPVACGLAVVEDDVAGLFDIVTDPNARRAGHGMALVTHLLARCASLGARFGYLQVLAANAPALALYSSLGLTELYRYWYRLAPR